MSLTPPPGQQPTSGPPARPSQVTRAAVQAIFGSVVGLLLMGTAVAQINSQQMRDIANQLRKQPMVAGDQLSQTDALNLIKISATIAAAACVASLVFAVFVLRRHRASRIGLTVLGGLLFASGIIQPLSGWFIAAYVGLCLYLLWSRSSRAWFSWKPGDPQTTPSPPQPPL